EREHVDGAAVVARAAVRLADVDALRAEGLTDGREDARTVRRHDTELHAAIDLRLCIPADVDPALGIGVEGLRATTAMDRDAAAPRDEAEDVVTGQRIAALRVTDEHVVDAVEADAAFVALGDLADETLQQPFFELVRRRARRAFGRGRRDDV